MENQLILENLKRLDERGKAIVLRCPIIPGYNDRPEHLKGIGRLADTLIHVRHIEIEPYHDLGVHKYAALGKTAAAIESMSHERAEAIVHAVQQGTRVPVQTA